MRFSVQFNKRLFQVITVLLGCAVLAIGHCSPPSGFELYLSPDESFGLYKPSGWQVTTQELANGKVILVADPATQAIAVMSIITTEDQTNDSVSLAASAVSDARVQIPDMKVVWAKSTGDRERTVVEIQYRDVTGTKRSGRYYFSMAYPSARSFGYVASEDDLPRLRSILMTILTNLTLTKPVAVNSGRTGVNVPRMQLIDLPVSRHWLPDRSGSIDMPAGWNLLGEQGQAFCLNPDSTTGFAFSISNFWGSSNIPYFNTPDMPGIVQHAYMQPIPAMTLVLQQLGASSVRVMQGWSDPHRAAEARAVLNRQIESETAFIEFVSREGVASKGYFDAVTFAPLPSGQWSVLYWAVWAPAETFDSYLPTLAKMAASYEVDEAWAADYIRKGMARLRQQMERTRLALDDAADSARAATYGAFQESMRSDDYIDYKRTGWLRGEQEWISEAEGGVLYKSDHWGLSREGEYLVEGEPFNYYNYSGKNPFYDEQMTPVDSSREIYEKVHGAHW